MKIKPINEIIQTHPFFKDFSEDEIKLISGCAKNQLFKKGALIAQEHAPADQFYVIRTGKIAVMVQMPDRTNKMIQTVSENEIFGWSWLFPPYEWMFDATALTETHVIAFNGKCLREKLDDTPVLGYKLMKRFAQLMIARLNATRLQVLDVYGKANH